MYMMLPCPSLFIVNLIQSILRSVANNGVKIRLPESKPTSFD